MGKVRCRDCLLSRSIRRDFGINLSHVFWEGGQASSVRVSPVKKDRRWHTFMSKLTTALNTDSNSHLSHSICSMRVVRISVTKNINVSAYYGHRKCFGFKNGQGKVYSITQDDWKTRCEHVKKVEEEYLRCERLIDDVTERFIISLGEDNNSELNVSDSEGNDADCPGSFEQRIIDDDDWISGMIKAGISPMSVIVLVAYQLHLPSCSSYPPNPHFPSTPSHLHARSISC
ncbi:hypothetical protein J6590_009963 [Homalodisca vitripennis]|nr:hypothetical protein J6590_009963 [Homalodisca vitripennis]